MEVKDLSSITAVIVFSLNFNPKISKSSHPAGVYIVSELENDLRENIGNWVYN